MPIVEPQAKHRYTARISIVVHNSDPSEAFRIATSLVQRVALGGNVYTEGSQIDRLVILQAEVERIEPEAVNDGR